MDAQEAIKYLKSMLFLVDMSGSTLKAIAANQMAISALEKVETLEAENARLRERETPIIKNNRDCPCCGAVDKNIFAKFCFNCGQAIKNDKE